MPHDQGARLAAVARRQLGVFTTHQAAGFGFTPRMIRTRLERGEWSRIHAKVLAHSSVPRSPRRELMAATLATQGVASHESAARLHGMHPVTGSVPVVTIAHSRRHHDRDGIRRHRYQDLTEEWITNDGPIPVTTPARTLLDLAAVLPRQRIERVLDHALDHRITSIEEVLGCFDALARAGRRGVAAMRPLLLARGTGVVADTSELERRFTRLLRGAGLPEPERQVLLGGATLIGRVDFVFRSASLVVEVDGRLGHSQLVDFEDDRRRDQRAMVAGLRVVRFTYRQISERPDEVVSVLRHLLAGPLVGT